MFVTLRYDFPISDFDVIPAYTKLEVLSLTGMNIQGL
jgi:hypothetical protein